MAKMNIEAERARLGMAKADMCKALEVAPVTYGRYIKGDSSIPSDILEKLAQITGKTTDYLLGLAE